MCPGSSSGRTEVSARQCSSLGRPLHIGPVRDEFHNRQAQRIDALVVRIVFALLVHLVGIQIKSYRNDPSLNVGLAVLSEHLLQRDIGSATGYYGIPQALFSEARQVGGKYSYIVLGFVAREYVGDDVLPLVAILDLLAVLRF